jgi:chemotaxis protein MotB
MKKLLSSILFSIILITAACSSEEMAKKEKKIDTRQSENAELKSEKKDLSYQIQLKEQELKYIKENLQENTKELENLRQQVKNLQNLEKDFAVLQTAKKANEEKMQDKIQSLTEEIQKKEKSLEEKNKQFQDMEEQLKKLQEDNQKLQLELEKQKQENELLKQQLQKKNDEAQKEQVKIKEMERSINQFQTQLVKKDEQIEEMKTAIRELKENQNQMQKESEKIREGLKQEIKNGDVVVNHNSRKIEVMMMEKVVFRKSEISLTPKGEKILKKMADVLKDIKDKEIFVIGHADSDPVTDPVIKKIFPTNWEFSVMRAVMVVRYLTEILGLDPAPFAAAGRSYYHPIVPESSEKNKALNRRTEILIFPKFQKVPASSGAKVTRK